MLGFPKASDGTLPWNRDDGTWDYGCPWPELEEAVLTLGAFDDIKDRLDPISSGAAQWLTGPYMEAMRLCREVRGG